MKKTNLCSVCSGDVNNPDIMTEKTCKGCDYFNLTINLTNYGKQAVKTYRQKCNQVIFSLTQYDLYRDYLDRCKEFSCIPPEFKSQEEYIEFFNSMWACPDGYETAYDRCLEWHEEVFLGFYK